MCVCVCVCERERKMGRGGEEGRMIRADSEIPENRRRRRRSCSRSSIKDPGLFSHVIIRIPHTSLFPSQSEQDGERREKEERKKRERREKERK